MFESITSIIKSKSGRRIALVLGTTVAVMTALHYYNQIKLTRMKIREMEKKGQGS